jgi:LmbE family N-acetylglucosaminyl deacetylase
VVVSPHLDDGVLSCGRLLAGNPGSLVITVLAGSGTSWDEPTEWDATCGFRPGDDVAGARRREDAAALAVVGARPVWLDLLDQQYRDGPTPAAEIAAAIAAVLPAAVPVVGPLGLIHPDHLAVADAVAMLRARDPDREWWAYADVPYEGRCDGEDDRRSAGLESGLPGPLGDPARKRAAIRRYRSQIRGLEVDLPLFGRPERYWRLGTMGG